MSKKQQTPNKAPYPTFGECFKAMVQSIDLSHLGEALSQEEPYYFPYTKPNSKDSVPAELLNKLSTKNCLIDWATEEYGPPATSEVQAYIAHALKPFPKEWIEDLNFIFQVLWMDIRDCHRSTLQERVGLQDQRTTRTWYAHAVARKALEWLALLQLQLKRIYKNGPMLEKPLQALLSTVWTEENHSLTQVCLKTFFGHNEKERVNPKTYQGWTNGTHLPSYYQLGNSFRDHDDREAIIFNFAFARLLENLSTHLDAFAPKKGRLRFYKSLIHQAQSLSSVYGVSSENLSTQEYYNALIQKWEEHSKALSIFSDLDDSIPIPDYIVAAVQYERDYLPIQLPSGWDDFLMKFNLVFEASGPHLKTLLTIPEDLEAQLQDIKKAYPKISKQFVGPISCVKARLKLTDTTLKPQQRLKNALRLYREAAENSVYSGGPYSKFILSEAMGFTAWVYRNALQSGRGKSGKELRPFMRCCYNWLNLLGLSEEFDHPQEDQRFEQAEHYFVEMQSHELREHLEHNLRGVEFYRIDFSSAISFLGFEARQKREATPINTRKKPFSKTVTGHKQTPLMEAIDRRQMDYAHELVEKEENLDFINSTRDNAVTKAFAAEDYELALKILRRGRDPISREKLLLPTKKLYENTLSLCITHGRLEILKELLEPSADHREPIDPSRKDCFEQTPLYFAVNLLGYWKMDFEEMMRNAGAMMPPTKAMQGLMPYMQNMTGRKREIFKATHDYYRKSANIDGVKDCFKYLLTNEAVEVDQQNHNGHTAFTLAIQSRAPDLAEMLLKAGADVNHDFDLGGTALCWAIRNEDLHAVQLLLKHGAKSDLYVEGMKQHIYELPMTPEIKKLIPNPN